MNNKLKYFLYILLILLLLILYLLISYKYESYKYKTNKTSKVKSKIEAYTSQLSNSQLQIKKSQFLQPFNSNVKIEWEEILTDYISEFNNINLKSRKVKSKQELINKYSHLCLLPISLDNIKSINKMLLTDLQSDNPCYKFIIKILPKIRIIKCDLSLEIGFPHTHKDIIVFSEEYLKSPLIETFIHECVHIDQRLNPNKYLKLYAKWGFIKYPIRKIYGLEKIISRSRMNPDGRDINWLWISPLNQSYWLGAVFTTSNPDSLTQVENRIYKINNVNNRYNTTEKIGKYIKNTSELIHNNREFNKYFGNIKNNNYHPNEIIAEYITQLYNNTLLEKEKVLSKTNNLQYLPPINLHNDILQIM
jgi:hypothetical protein